LNPLCYSYIDSPVGRLLVAGDETALHFLSFPDGRKAIVPRPEWRQSDAPFAEVGRQLGAYFAGELKDFALPLRLSGTDFQLRVWRALEHIPYDESRSYGDIAREIGSPAASRAVGAANGSNPIPVILPCHRVIGADGSLTGFGGGLRTKEFLLRHEKITAGTDVAQMALFEEG